MKGIFVFACLLAMVYGLPPELVQKFKEELMRIGMPCKGKVGATDDDVMKLKAHEIPSTQTGKCFIACVNKGMGYQDENGKPDKAAALACVEKLKAYDEDFYTKMKKVAEICTDVPEGGDECETAANMMECFEREKKAAGIEPIDFN